MMFIFVYHREEFDIYASFMSMNEADADDVNTTLISAFHILIHSFHSVLKIPRWTTKDTDHVLSSGKDRALRVVIF